MIALAVKKKIEDEFYLGRNTSISAERQNPGKKLLKTVGFDETRRYRNEFHPMRLDQFTRTFVNSSSRQRRYFDTCR